MPFSTVSLSELMNTQRALKAALISPLAISPIILIGAIINLIEQSFDMGILVVIIFFSLGALITVYALVFFVGLPIHYFLSVLNFQRWYIYVTAALLPAFIYCIINMLKNGAINQAVMVGALIYSVLAVLVSFLFWYIAVKSNVG